MTNWHRFARDLNEMQRHRRRRDSVVWDYREEKNGADGAFLTAPARPGRGITTPIRSKNGIFYDQNSAFNNYIRKILDARNVQVAINTYDSNGRLSTITDPDNRQTTFTYFTYLTTTFTSQYRGAVELQKITDNENH